MTETSLLPQAAEAAGIGFDELIARICSTSGGLTAAELSLALRSPRV